MTFKVNKDQTKQNMKINTVARTKLGVYNILVGQDLPEAIVLFYLFIFEISMDMLTLQMNVCMYEFIYD